MKLEVHIKPSISILTEHGCLKVHMQFFQLRIKVFIFSTLLTVIIVISIEENEGIKENKKVN